VQAAALRFLQPSLQELSRCALWLSAWDHQGSRDPEEKSQHNRQTEQTDRQNQKKQKTKNKKQNKTEKKQEQNVCLFGEMDHG
jgi:hypothetical protein